MREIRLLGEIQVGSGSRYTNFQSMIGDGVAFRIFWTTGSHPSRTVWASDKGACACQLSSTSASSCVFISLGSRNQYTIYLVSANPTEFFPVLYGRCYEMYIRSWNASIYRRRTFYGVPTQPSTVPVTIIDHPSRIGIFRQLIRIKPRTIYGITR